MKPFSLAEILRRVFFYCILSFFMPVSLAFIFNLKYIIIHRGELLNYNEHLDGLIFGSIIFLIFFSIWSIFSFFIYDIMGSNFSKRKILNRKSKLLIQFCIGIFTTIVMLLCMDKYWIRNIWGAGWGGYFTYFLFLFCYSLVVHVLHYLLIDKKFSKSIAR
jgi:hypothetical protein